jgi:myo-inositol-hexaphosphate 3-phosphohydrolase
MEKLCYSRPAMKNSRLATGAAALATCVAFLQGCTTPATAPAAQALVLERVAMVMRHGTRPPTRAEPTPKGTTDKPWSSWATGIGQLTPRGAEGARLVGAYQREELAARGLLAPAGCPSRDELRVEASSKQRAIDTARAFAAGFAPGCPIDVSHPANDKADVVFHPLEAGMRLDLSIAEAAANARAGGGGIAAATASHRDDFDVLQRVLRCCAPPVCAAHGARSACTVGDLPSELRKGDVRVALHGSLEWASTASQTLLLEYVEGKPAAEVGWGRATRDDIRRLLAFHPTKFDFEVRPPYIAERYAGLLASRLLESLDAPGGPRLALFVGHDTNIAALGGFFNDMHWAVADYPRDEPPPGGALGFERLRDAAGRTYIRAFYQAQSMDQLRNLERLDRAHPPARVNLEIPGCREAGDPTLCELERFRALVRHKVESPAATAHVASEAMPSVEVASETGDGDMDDPAIWIHPDPARAERSLVIATVKRAGLRVYDLAGRTLQSIVPLKDAKGAAANRFNNVDVQYQFPLGGRLVDIAVASDRIRDRFSIWRTDADAATPLSEFNAADIPRLFPTPPDPADPATKTLPNPDDGKRTAYGLALYRDRAAGRYYALVTQAGEGVVAKWELVATASGHVSARFVKEWRFPYVHKGQDLTREVKGEPAKTFSPQFEGLAVDQQSGIAYAGQEDVGIWRIHLANGADRAEPRPFVETSVFDRASPIARDVEGLSIYYGRDGAGYLIASSQGKAHGKPPHDPMPGLDDTFAVFERRPPNRYLGSFRIVANAAKGIDGVQECDGADVTSIPLPGFPGGLFAAQDGYDDDRFDGKGGTNLKLTPWSSIAGTFRGRLESDTNYDPRRP